MSDRERELRAAALLSIHIAPNENSGRRPNDPLEVAMPDDQIVTVDEWLTVSNIVGHAELNSRRPRLANDRERVAYLRASLRRWAANTNGKGSAE